MRNYDSIFKNLFKSKLAIKDLLIHFIDEPIIKEIDLAAIQLLPTVLNHQSKRSRIVDLVFQAKLTMRKVFVIFIIEFQLNDNKFMALRSNTYTSLTLEYLIDIKNVLKYDKLPPVMLIVLYNGKRKWQSKKQLLDSFVKLPKRFNVDKYLPKIEYLLLDFSQITLNELKAKKNSFIAKMLEIEQTFDVMQAINLFIEACRLVDDDGVLSSLEEWFKLILESKGIKEPVFEVNKEMIKTGKKLINNIFDEARQKGLAEGKAEGKAINLLSLS